jgi:hypothetical protein
MEPTIEDYMDHHNADCPIYMDISSKSGYWCVIHNVDLTEPPGIPGLDF